MQPRSRHYRTPQFFRDKPDFPLKVLAVRYKPIPFPHDRLQPLGMR